MFYQISGPEAFISWDGGQGLEDLGEKDSQRVTPPNREMREVWVVRRMALAGGSASPDSRHGAPGVSPGSERLRLSEIVPF